MLGGPMVLWLGLWLTWRAACSVRFGTLYQLVCRAPVCCLRQVAVEARVSSGKAHMSGGAKNSGACVGSAPLHSPRWTPAAEAQSMGRGA
jgi:hypothetical protein